MTLLFFEKLELDIGEIAVIPLYKTIYDELFGLIVCHKAVSERQNASSNLIFFQVRRHDRFFFERVYC